MSLVGLVPAPTHMELSFLIIALLHIQMREIVAVLIYTLGY